MNRLIALPLIFLSTTALAAQNYAGGNPQSLQYNSAGQLAGLTIGPKPQAFSPIGGYGSISGVTLQAQQAAFNLDQLTQGLIVDPREYGATCDAHPFIGSNGGYINTTAGSATISVSSGANYAFVAADAGKTIGIAGAGTYTITAVNGTAATLSAAPAVTVANDQAVMGHDDTTAIHNISFYTAAFHAGYLIAPNNCLIRNLVLANGTSVIGASVGNGYGYSHEVAMPTWYILGSGNDNDPAFGIQADGADGLGLRGFVLYGPKFPYPSGPGTVCVGTDAGTTNSSTALVLEDMTIENCMVGLGRSPGHTGPYLFGQSRNTSFLHNGYGTYGPLSDWSSSNDEMGNNFFAGFYLGPQLGAPSSSNAVRITNARIEYNGVGVVCDGCLQLNIDNTQFDANGAEATSTYAASLLLLNAWQSVSVTGGFMRAVQQKGATNWAQVVLAGTPGAVGHLTMDNVQFFKNAGNLFPNTPYDILGVTAGTANPSIDVEGGSAALGYNTAFDSWPLGKPASYRISISDIPTANTAPPGRIVTASGAVAMTADDNTVEIAKTAPAATSVALPANPILWKDYTVKDGGFNAATNNITLAPPSGTIDGNPTLVMNQNGQSITTYWNGTNWRIK